MTDLTIVIPTLGRKSIFALLSSIEAQTHLYKIEIKVVCNPPNINLRRYLENRPGFQYLESKIGANSARNIGWRKAQSPWVYFLDDDTILPHPRHIENVMKTIKMNQGKSILGGPYRTPLPAGVFALAYQELQDSWLQSGYRNSLQWIHLLGGNIIVKKESLDENLFCDDLVFGGTETELFYRWAQQGHTMTKINDLFVFHQVEINWASFIYKNFQQGVGHAFLSKKMNADDLFLFRNPEGRAPGTQSLVKMAIFCHRAGQSSYLRNHRLMNSYPQILWEILVLIKELSLDRWKLFLSRFKIRKQLWMAYLDAETIREKYRENIF